MEDVAREAGVARVTVSRALSHPDKVSPATRAAVRAAIEQQAMGVAEQAHAERQARHA